jgi:hypothetical protein
MSTIASYLDLLDDQREAIFRQIGALPDAVLRYRPGLRVWSLGEHLAGFGLQPGGERLAPSPSSRTFHGAVT